ncbi:MAG TPA: hypothetical protein PKC74_08775 [Turneriella sp.]|nr:hypothetical protein [Turneriella sp.]HMY11706.1 hypothetical protein [Turneriella sp.]
MKYAAIIVLVSAMVLPARVHSFFAPGDQTLEQAVAAGAPVDLFLKYQAHEGDYLVFYDATGSILLVRYRRDRWDYDQDTLRDSLRQGITYRIRCRNLNKLPEGEVPAGVMGAGLPRVTTIRKIRRIRDLYAGELEAVTESALRDLRY